MQTQRLDLVPQTKRDTYAMVEAMSPATRAELSAAWLARLDASSEIDPWTHGFAARLLGSDARVGSFLFKDRPSADGVVELAYGVEAEHRNRGYATEAVEALVAFAFAAPEVATVIAHTLPRVNASTRVLTKCHFTHVGETIDPEDGLVWRWERRRGGP